VPSTTASGEVGAVEDDASLACRERPEVFPDLPESGHVAAADLV
jgi:hypothetical protein